MSVTTRARLPRFVGKSGSSVTTTIVRRAVMWIEPDRAVTQAVLDAGDLLRRRIETRSPDLRCAGGGGDPEPGSAPAPADGYPARQLMRKLFPIPVKNRDARQLIFVARPHHGRLRGRRGGGIPRLPHEFEGLRCVVPVRIGEVRHWLADDLFELRPARFDFSALRTRRQRGE